MGRFSWLRALSVLAASISFASACEETSGPGNITGTYVLTAANGNPVPTTVLQM